MFITFEGTEGVGKSTLIATLKTKLEERGLVVTLTREPGGATVAEKIRKLILENPMDPYTELFLYEAARAEHLAQILKPALARKEIVLCDRFTDSTLAYQAHARGLPWKTVTQLNRAATQGLCADLTVFIDGDPAEGLKRAKDPNRFELEGVRFQTKVRQGFLKAKKENKKRWFTLKAYSATPEIMADRVIAELMKRKKIKK